MGAHITPASLRLGSFQSGRTKWQVQPARKYGVRAKGLHNLKRADRPMRRR
jgi:hypothetical protein